MTSRLWSSDRFVASCCCAWMYWLSVAGDEVEVTSGLSRTIDASRYSVLGRSRSRNCWVDAAARIWSGVPVWGATTPPTIETRSWPNGSGDGIATNSQAPSSMRADVAARWMSTYGRILKASHLAMYRTVTRYQPTRRMIYEASGTMPSL